MRILQREGSEHREDRTGQTQERGDQLEHRPCDNRLLSLQARSRQGEIEQEFSVLGGTRPPESAETLAGNGAPGKYTRGTGVRTYAHGLYS